MRYGLDSLVADQITEDWKKRWVLKFLSSEDPKNTIVRWPYNIPCDKGFKVEVGELPDGEYELACGDSTKQASKTHNGKTFTVYGTKRRVFSVIDGEVVYPFDENDKYADGKRASLPNFGNPVRGQVTPTLNIPNECLTREYCGKQSSLDMGEPRGSTISSPHASLLKLDDYALEDILEGSSYKIVDCGEGRFMMHYLCPDCGEAREFQLRPKREGEFKD